MLCRTIRDPYGVEEGGEIDGLGLIDAQTVFEQEKTRTRVEGRFEEVPGVLSALSGARFEGYEIHMGTTAGETRLSFLCDADGKRKTDGISDGVSVYGSYVHGLFDSNEVLQALASALSARKGIAPADGQAIDRKAYKERQYDLLADALRKSLDMDKIYAILDEGIRK